MTHPYNTESYVKAISGDSGTYFSETLGVWLCVRRIPGSDRFDACGVYPFSPQLRPVSRGALAREVLEHSLVSLVFVTDVFQSDLDWTEDLDFSRSYKEHHIVAHSDGEICFSKHHRREVRRGQRHCSVRQVRLGDHLDSWRLLYDELIARRRLGDAHRFSDAYFRSLSDETGFVTFAAFIEDRMVSCHVFARCGAYAYSHLAASSQEGYQAGAAYAVYGEAIARLGDGTAIDLGGAPDGEAAGGALAFVKRGFANASQTNRLCGVIADPAAYDQLCGERSSFSDIYFPRYRGPGGSSPITG